MNVDLDKATEAAAQGIWDSRPMQRTTDGAPLPFVYAKTYEQRRCRDHAQAALTAAYPHVFAAVVEALRARAEGDGDAAYAAWQHAELGTGGPDHGAQKASEDAYGAAAWLARIAHEGTP